VYPYHNNQYVPKGNRKFLFCFNALSEIWITLQIILHTIQNIIKRFHTHSVTFSELIGTFSQYLAQFKIFSIISWIPNLMRPPSSSVRVLQAKATYCQQKFIPVSIRRVNYVPFTALKLSRLRTRSSREITFQSDRFQCSPDINNSVVVIYLLVWSLSRLLCFVGSGSNVAAALAFGSLVFEVWTIWQKKSQQDAAGCGIFKSLSKIITSYE
jgi:hypothetical protein